MLAAGQIAGVYRVNILTNICKLAAQVCHELLHTTIVQPNHIILRVADEAWDSHGRLQSTEAEVLALDPVHKVRHNMFHYPSVYSCLKVVHKNASTCGKGSMFSSSAAQR